MCDWVTMLYSRVDLTLYINYTLRKISLNKEKKKKEAKGGEGALISIQYLGERSL